MRFRHSGIIMRPECLIIRHDSRHATFYSLSSSQGHRTPANESARPICRPRAIHPHVHANATRRSSLPRVSIVGAVKLVNSLLIDGEVKGTIDSTGKLTIGEQARIGGEIRTKSVKVR